MKLENCNVRKELRVESAMLSLIANVQSLTVLTDFSKLRWMIANNWDRFFFHPLSCAINLCCIINMTWTNNKQVVRYEFPRTWHILANELGVKQWIQCTVYWKKNKWRDCTVSITGYIPSGNWQVGHNAKWNPTEKVSHQKSRNSFLHFFIWIFLEKCGNILDRGFLVNKYIDDHHIYEEREIKCDKANVIFPSTFNGRQIKTRDANTCFRIKPKFSFYLVVLERR